MIKLPTQMAVLFQKRKSNFVLANSLGFSKGYESSMFSAGCAVVAERQRFNGNGL